MSDVKALVIKTYTKLTLTQIFLGEYDSKRSTLDIVRARLDAVMFYGLGVYLGQGSGRTVNRAADLHCNICLSRAVLKVRVP